MKAVEVHSSPGGDIGRRQEIPVENPQEEVANFILGNGHGIAAYDLAQKVYNDNGEVIIASNLLVAQQDFIRNGDSFVTITANLPNAPYQYTGIVQMWDPE